ncbi:hypothetical protein GRF29_164g715977 [Pseudopithomyces chartarum]|uniref:Solute carrier family 40 member n=1 Tax=Pseudopithomyces chartarum TaxID=1892770 RepID=A0AAN6LPE7_9PLEO|nr:hypothetical protein GRF29_164g715977 [Pseudopithomyces chartarum]
MPPPPELLDTSPPSDNDTCVVDPDPTQEDPFDTPPPHAIDSILWKLYLSHALSTWNARAFEFGAVIFLSAIFPGTLFYASIYALIRALAAFVFSAQNILSVVFEYFAIAQVYKIVPELHSRSGKPLTASPGAVHRRTSSPIPSSPLSTLRTTFQPWKAYFLNPAFLASFSLALLYFTVLGFGSQLTTYLLTLGLTPIHISAMRLISVILELTATCAAPLLMRRIGAVRAGLWFINLQLLATCLAIGLFTYFSAHPLTSGLSLVAGVTLSRLGLWGFDLCVQYLVQEDAPEASRGSFSALCDDDGVGEAEGLQVAGEGEWDGGCGGGDVLCGVCEGEEGPFASYEQVFGEEEWEV